MARLDRGSKKVAKEVDPFFAFMGKLQQWAVKYWLYLIIAGGVVAVAFVIAYTVEYLRESKEEAAWTHYFNVKIEQQKGGPAALEEVAVQHPDTVAGRLANLEIARKLYREGRYSDALGYVETVKETGEPFFDFPLKLLKAKIFDKLGKYEEALSIYEELMVTEEGLILGVEPYVQASIIYFKTGNTEAAVNTLRQGMMKFQKGGEVMAILLSSFMRMMGLSVVTPSELF